MLRRVVLRTRRDVVSQADLPTYRARRFRQLAKALGARMLVKPTTTALVYDDTGALIGETR